MIEIKHCKSGRPLYRVYTDTLEGIDLRGAQLGRAELAGANLRGADLSGAYLDEANLAGADLAGASLRHCFLQQTELAGARLQGSDLSGSLLRRTRLADADLTGADLTRATHSPRMRWPSGFDPVAAGALPEEWERPEVASLYVEILGHVRRQVLAWQWHHLSTHFNLGFHPSEYEPLGIRLCPPLTDRLEVGPQDVDLSLQTQLRQEFFRDTDYAESVRRDLWCLERYAQALATGQEVLFWCDPELTSCLGILWALDALDQRGADFRNASLLLWPTTSSELPRSELETRRAFEELIPVREVLEPLIAVRRHLASDSDAVEADLTGLPPRVREWAAVTDNMIDYLPDGRGLDVADGHLLNFLTDEWQPAKAIILRFPYPREPGWGTPTLCCDRLMEMSGAVALRAGGCLNPSDALVEARRRDEGHLWDSRLRITLLGSRVRAGEEDWLARGGFSRWVGGRLVSKDRPLRRQRRMRAAGAPLDRGP